MHGCIDGWMDGSRGPLNHSFGEKKKRECDGVVRLSERREREREGKRGEWVERVGEERRGWGRVE